MPETNDSTTVVRIRASQFCSEGKGFNFKGFETALAELFSQFASMKTKAESLPDVKNAIMVITTTSKTAMDTSVPMEIDPRYDTNGNEKLGSEETSTYSHDTVDAAHNLKYHELLVEGQSTTKSTVTRMEAGHQKSDAAVLAIRFQLDRPSSSCACVPLPCSRRSEVGNKRQR
ncbi:hypothetical protein B0H14DRAFT_2574127 [Mycena olivaceomarginata]|nr:hypothetical protein B0H14DRAFT_2574127 [Mycena olivaceomarginata]